MVFGMRDHEVKRKSGEIFDKSFPTGHDKNNSALVQNFDITPSPRPSSTDLLVNIEELPMT